MAPADVLREYAIRSAEARNPLTPRDMPLATITLKNYRVFADSSPAVLTIGRGFTALVGPNNAGKSSFLKFLFEYQSLWGSLLSTEQRANWVLNPGAPYGGFGLREVADPAEVTCDLTGRPIQIQIDFPVDSSKPHALSRVILAGAGDQPTTFTGEFYFGPGRKRVTAASNPHLFDSTTQPANHIDCTALEELAADLYDAMYVGPFRNAINL